MGRYVDRHATQSCSNALHHGRGRTPGGGDERQPLRDGASNQRAPPPTPGTGAACPRFGRFYNGARGLRSGEDRRGLGAEAQGTLGPRRNRGRRHVPLQALGPLQLQTPRFEIQPHGRPPPSRQRVTAAVAFSAQPTPANSWAAVTSRTHPAPPHTTARPLIDDAYLEIKVSSFRFHNEHFPEDVKNQIFYLSTTVYTALTTTHHAKAPLRFARDLASKECSPLQPEIVYGNFTLCDVVRWAYNSGADRQWFATTIRNSQAAATRKPHTQADSSASDSSVEVPRQRPREEPSSGRGKTKRVMTALTSDRDSSSETTRRNDRDLRYLRQVPRFYHAPFPNDGSDPPFPPRIARTNIVHRLAPPRSLTTYTPALGTHASCPPTTLNEDFSPPTTHQLVDTITSATLAGVNQYLANIGLLLQTTPDSQPPAPSLARTTPDPPVLVETPAPAPPPRSTHYVDNDMRYLQDSRLPHPLSMPPPSGFDNVFTTKMQPEYRTLDTRRVPKVQPLQFSPHMDRTFFSFFSSFISLIADEPRCYHPACGHKGSSHLSPVHALQFFIAMQVQHSYSSSTNG